MDNNCSLMWEIMGPGVAGAVFGAGWWFWVDAVVCSSVKVSFLHYLPGNVPLTTLTLLLSLGFRIFIFFSISGIFASLAALMFNCVKKEDISYDYYSPYGESEWRSNSAHFNYHLFLQCNLLFVVLCSIMVTRFPTVHVLYQSKNTI